MILKEGATSPCNPFKGAIGYYTMGYLTALLKGSLQGVSGVYPRMFQVLKRLRTTAFDTSHPSYDRTGTNILLT